MCWRSPFTRCALKRTWRNICSCKGIGLEICRQLASNGVMVVLTARDEKRGLEAVAKLHESSLSNVVFISLM
ncbi:hypothetical protein AAG906_038238 [Vitis piasezkii]